MTEVDVKHHPRLYGKSKYGLSNTFKVITDLILMLLNIRIPNLQNLKLYALGMFYNLFLPGGSGGDGYKVYLLRKLYKAPVKHLLSAVLLDRINGVAVVFLCLSCS